MPRPTEFRSAAAFRAWLAQHHAAATALSVRIFRAHALDRGLGYSEALDEALCYGWIDGVRHRHDDDSFLIRWSPRKPRSIWSAINIRRANALVAAGRMREAGLTAFQARQGSRSAIYAYENRERGLDPASERTFRAHRKAWRYYSAQAPWYRRTSAYWVVSAKREETRAKRLATLIACSARGELLPQLRRETAPLEPRRAKPAARA